MRCPYCGDESSRVLEKRDSDDYSVRRRRECLNCSKRFTTYEKIESTLLRIIKKDGSRENYDRNKLRKGVLIACEKRPITDEQIDDILNDIEMKLMQKESTEIASRFIGQLVMNRLKKLDHVAYIRFASVYREFKDLEELNLEVKKILQK